MAVTAPYTMTPLEIARGMVFGGPTPGSSSDRGQLGQPAPHPRAALEEILREALEATPCVVAFSGGRDSSALLAVAAAVARRDGLPLPLPVTRRHGSIGDADESRWQELVVRHLALPDWEVVEVPDGDLDLLGPIATPRLLEHGVTWSPLSHQDAPVVTRASGGAVVDGEGGDQMLIESLHRIAPVAQLLRSGGAPSLRPAAKAAAALAPPALGRISHRRRVRRFDVSWLRAEAREQLERDHARELASRPLRFSASVALVPRRGPLRLGLMTRAYFAGLRDVDYFYPFLDERFASALGRLGGWRGVGTRTEAMRMLVGDLLPDAILRRGTKARFNAVLFGGATRRFVEDWSGDGVDHRLVDVEVLRRIWRSENPHARTAALLQSAWLAGRRDP